MPKKIIAVLLSVLVIVTAFALPTFAAEDEAAAAPSVDWSKYPTMNLITFPYVNSTVSIGGLNWSVQDDFGVAVKGEITGYSQFTLAEIPLASDTAYTFNLGRTVLSCGITAEIILLDSLGVSVSKIYVSLQREFVSFSTADYDNVVSARISLLRQSSGLTTNVVDCVIYPMLNVGSEPYPYSPYMPYLLEQQYNNGYTNGEAAGDQEGYDRGFFEGTNAGIIQGTEQGYKEGYQAGLDASATPANPFAIPFTSTVTASRILYTASDGSQQFIADFSQVIAPPLTSDYSVDLRAFLQLIKQSCQNAVLSVDSRVNVDTISVFGLIVTFAWTPTNINTGAFYFLEKEVLTAFNTADSGVFSVSCLGYLDSVSTRYNLTKSPAMSEFVYAYTMPDDVDLAAFSVYEMRFTMGNFLYINDYEQNAFIVPQSLVSSPTYLAGYNKGYYEGAANGVGPLKDVYYNQGYNEGFKNGRIDGLKVAETGDWNHLMTSVIEAPVNALQSLFDFEVLGLDMRVAVGTILTFCVVMIVFKKVVF